MINWHARLMAILLALVAISGALHAQVTPAGPKLSGADQGGILYASNFGQWQVPAGNLGQYSWNNASYCQPTVGSVYPGITINGFAAGTPVEIVDLDTPAHSEIVIPSAYYIAPNRSSCSISISPIYGHNHFYFASATAGLQEALNWAGTTSYEVILTPDWTLLGGTTGMIAAAQGNANVTIFDQRTSGLAAYGWIGGAYVLIPWSFSGGGAINTGTNGQIAYYAAPGSTLSGESYVAVTQGGTGATTAASGLANLDGVSLSPSADQNILPTNGKTKYGGSELCTAGNGLCAYSLPPTVVQTNQANAYGAYLQDFSGATMKFPLTATMSAGGTLTWPTSGTVATTGQIGTWGALNYPSWSSGTPFVKMTAAGMFVLDTNTYLTSSGVSGMTQYGLSVAASATTVTSSVQPGSWTTGHTFVPVWQPSGSALAPTVVDANTLSVSYAATAGSAPDSTKLPLVGGTMNNNAAIAFQGTGAATTLANLGGVSLSPSADQNILPTNGKTKYGGSELCTAGNGLCAYSLPPTVVQTNQANSYTAGMKQTVLASATTAGFAFGGVTADPSSPVAGDMDYRTDLTRPGIYTAAWHRLAFTDDLTAYAPLSGAAFTGAINVSGPIQINAQGTATSISGNYSSYNFQELGSYWNGSAAVGDTWFINDVLGTGTAPTSTLTFGHTGSGGVASVSIPYPVTLTTINGLTPTAASTGFTLAGGTTSKTLTVAANFNTGTTDGTLASGAFAAAYSLPSQYTHWSCQPGLGDGLNAITAGTYLQTECKNTTGVSITLTGLSCYVDGGTSSTMNASGNTLGALLTGPVTCSTSFAAGTPSSNVTLTNGDYIKFTFVADGTAKQTTWVVTGTH